MKSKTLIVVLGISAASVAGAYMALSQSKTSSEIARGAQFLPRIGEIAAQLTRVEIERGMQKISLVRDGTSWMLASSDGYPVRFEEVKGLVAGLDALKLDDRMTSRTDRHGELGLAWPDDSGRGARIRLFADSDKPAIDVILGSERANPRGQFVRRADEDQCWRVLGSVSVDVDPRRWVEAELLAIPDGEVRSVTFDGLTLLSTESADGRVSYAAVEPAAPLAAPASIDWTDARKEIATRTLPNWLSRLELDDARRAKGIAPDPALSLSYDMVRGTLRVNAVRDGDSVWISFEAAPKEGAPSTDEINAKKKYPGDPFIPDWKTFAAMHAGWEYKLPAWKLNSLEEARNMPDPNEASSAPAEPTQLPSARD
jgi:hypothetical protein